MSRRLEIRKICEEALRRIGAFAIRSSGARPEELEVARNWLDMIVGHVAARQRAWWLVPSTAELPLVGGQQSYDLTMGLAATDGVQFVVGTYLYDVDQIRDVREVVLLRREEWEQIEDKLRQGSPERAYIDRQNDPAIMLHPIPDGTRMLRLRVLFQTFGGDLTSTQFVDQTFKIRQSWNLYLVTALAAEIGNGPVRKLAQDEVKEMKDAARQLLFDLEAYDVQEQANEPRRVLYFGGV